MPRIHFAPFVLDLETRQLTRAGRVIHLAPKAFELLALLVAERPKAISKEELQNRLWTDTFVVEANLSNLVAEIREALSDLPRAPQFVRTVHGYGYSFCAEATTTADGRAIAAGPPSCWLEWEGQRFPLVSGLNVVGRDADVTVRLDASTISRRHACLIVADTGTRLEDLGSKNGTYRGEDRLQGPVDLFDGDTIGFGSLRLTFHTRGGLATTETQSRH
jgi:DNA-binding winged helix-turn-helix (wHTH) protein